MDLSWVLGRLQSCRSTRPLRGTLTELSDLMHKWPPAVINHMVWRQRELEEMRAAAKVKYRQNRPSPCTFCGTLIRCDMYRHVARCHLDLAQLWRCPVSRCTVWRGTPQDLMDHIRGAHNVPGEIRSASLEKYLPPWTVTRQVYTDSLRSRHSGISNDVLLFSDIGLSLVHQYKVHKRGLPHVAFRRNYLSQLRALLPLPTVLPIAGGSPDATCSTLQCAAESPDVVCASPRPSRCAIRRRWPVRIMEWSWRLHHMGREKTLSAALQLQHDAGLILSNVQVLQQLVTALNRTSSEVMRVVHGRRPFPTDVMHQVMPSYRVRRAAHYMTAMGLWRPPTTPEVRGPLPLATCNACMSCSDCFPDVPQ